MSVVFDIETEPLPDEELARVVDPFDPASMPQPGEFNEADVKLGNLKDEKKIAEKIEAARAAHTKAVVDHDETVRKAAFNYWAEIVERATLDATTGRVCAIGYKSGRKEIISTALETDEQMMLKAFWGIAAKTRAENRKMIGHNIAGFDIPFLVRRSWINGITVPDWVTMPTGYLSTLFIDTMQIWQVGNRRDYVKLDRLARSLGCGEKPDNCTGAMFWRMLRGTGAEQEAAIEYLRNDITMTFEVARKLGLV